MKKIIYLFVLILPVANLSAQNVGFGTVNPSSKLSVKGIEDGIGTAAEINYQLIRSGKHTATGVGVPILSFAGAIGTLKVVGRSASGADYTTGEYRIINGGWNYPSQASITNLASVTRGSGVSLSVTSADGGGGDMAVLISASAGSLIFWSFEGLTEQINNYTALPGIRICGKTWMSKNLDVSNYRNGDPIPYVSAGWENLTTGAWCWYNDDSATYAATYGKLYNWYAVNDPRGLAPQGWHVPTDAEWVTLTDCLGGDAIAGGKMKSVTLWDSPNTGATNSSGFTGLPGGFRNGYGIDFSVGSLGVWWSSTETGGNLALFRVLSYNNAIVARNSDDKRFGLSVRCVRD